jgi:hypothetical protein
MGALELHDSGVDNVMKAAGGGPPEGEEHLHRTRKPSDTPTPADWNSRQAARLNQNEEQKAGCKDKKKGCKAWGERNQSRSSVNETQA